MLFDKTDESLSRTLKSVVAVGLQSMSPYRIDWKLIYHYMQGRRAIAIGSWLDGDLQVGYETDKGKPLFRWEDIVEQYNRELGQMLQVDISPKVDPNHSFQLDGVRKAAVSQAWLDHITGSLPMAELKKELLETSLMYGTTGIAVWCNTDSTLAMDASFAVIPPWQLIPMPARARRRGELRGLVYTRVVPYQEYRDRAGKALKWPDKGDYRNPDASLEVEWLRVGESAEDHQRNLIVPGMTVGDSRAAEEREGLEPFIRVNEIWVPDQKDRLRQKIVMIGRHIAQRQEWKTPDEKVRMPIGVVQSQHSNNFYCRPWLSMILPVNMETEKCLTNLFKNMQALKTMPLTLIPADRGITKEMLQSTDEYQAVFYTPDFTGNPLKVESVQPVNAGDIPGRTAKFGTELADRVGRNSPLYQGKSLGRLDSPGGLSFVYETSNVPRNPFFTSIENAMSVVYSCLLGAGTAITQTPFALRCVDDAIAGLVLDRDGKVSLATNALPTPDEVSIGIKERAPRSITQRKQEVLAMKQQGVMDLVEFVWLNHREDLGFILGHEDIVEQITLGMLRNIILFGDGEVPGSQAFDTSADDLDIQIRVISRFMKTVRFSLASPQVKQAFKDVLAQYRQAKGSYPEQLPYPEEAEMPPLPPALARQLAAGGVPSPMTAGTPTGV